MDRAGTDSDHVTLPAPEMLGFREAFSVRDVGSSVRITPLRPAKNIDLSPEKSILSSHLIDFALQRSWRYRQIAFMAMCAAIGAPLTPNPRSRSAFAKPALFVARSTIYKGCVRTSDSNMRRLAGAEAEWWDESC